MDGDSSKASITPIDLRCRQPNCTCESSIPLTLNKVKNDTQHTVLSV
jgi:hypothetical protein